MPDDTIRMQLIEEIEARLDDFSWTTLTDPSVFVGRSIFNTESDPDNPDLDVDPLPLFAILAGMEDTEQRRYNIDTDTMPVSITCIVSLEDGADAYTICEPIYGEMKKALFEDGDLELGTEDSGSEIEAFPFFRTGGGIEEYPSEFGPAIVKIIISAVVKYETTTGDPYN